MRPQVDFSREIDKAAREVKDSIANGASYSSVIPSTLRSRIDSWRFGQYGWISPVNLMITASWLKWLMPSYDVCKIWAKDSEGGQIAGGYSIRSLDEKYTVPLVCKYEIHPHFCSNNSGMQGTRAIEKTRRATRLDRGMQFDQRVLFDLQLFINIFNDINDLSAAEAKSTFQYFLEKGFKIKLSCESSISSMLTTAINANSSAMDKIRNGIASIHDPQFVKIIVAAFIQHFMNYSPILKGGILCGIEGTKTGADARSKEPGDLWIKVNGTPYLGCEVKDASKTFGFEIITAIRNRFQNNRTLKVYLMITASAVAVKEEVINDPHWAEQLLNLEMMGLTVTPISLNEFMSLYTMFSVVGDEMLIAISKQLSMTPDLKLDTIAKWRSIIS